MYDEKYHNEKGKFKKGNPGGGYPTGKPNLSTIIKKLSGISSKSKHPVTGEELTELELMVVMLFKEGRKGNVQAIRELFDRIDGKPKQEQEVTVNEYNINITDDD